MTIDEFRVALATTARVPTDDEIKKARKFTRDLIAENRELFDMLAKL
jgi:hypothetical protein